MQVAHEHASALQPQKMGGCASTHILDALQVALQCFALSAFMRQLILRLGKLVGDLHIPTRHARKPGMKVMLLDSATAAAVSLVCSQSQALEHQVYHVDKLGNPRRGTRTRDAHTSARRWAHARRASCARAL